jgi:hypothetical protein
MIPNNGNLAETAPLKLLLAMDEQNQTGILYFRKNEILKVFYLNGGKISWAISSDEEDKIERVLLAQKLVNPEAIAPYLAGNKISESFGKILVENGLISLETLINASREQLKRIATSVMFWNSGNYQLEPESPPTRLVSLELEIVPLIYNYIQAHMDVNIIWEELGSLSGELCQVPEAEKIFQYNLDAEQQEVFAYFREAQRPENVLLRFPAERKHAILKILYFLVVTGLLIKKEAGMNPTLDFNELDSLFGHTQLDAQDQVEVDIPAMINEADIKDIPQLDLPDMQKPQGVVEVSLPKISDLTPNPVAGPKNKALEIPLSPRQKKTPAKFQPLLQEKSKSKWLSASFVSILLTIIVIALFLWFGRTSKNPEPQPLPKRPAVRTKPNPAPAQAAASAEQILKAENPGSGPLTTSTPEPIASTEKAAAKPQSAAVTTREKPPAEKKEPASSQKPLHAAANARQAFAAGNLSAAGDLWRQEMLADQIGFSILLEMDCLEESVHGAYQQVTDKESFFLLNRFKNGRNCWLVLWGKFRTQNEAQQNLELVPPYFFKQSAPPVIVELKPYL